MDPSYLLVLLTRYGGVNPYKGIKKKLISAYHLLIAVILISGTVLIVYTIYMSGKTEHITRFGFFGISGSLIIPKAVTFCYYEKVITETIRSVIKMVKKRDNTIYVERFKSASRYGWIGYHYMSRLLFIAFALYFISPLIVDICIMWFTNSKKPLFLPEPNVDYLLSENPTRSLSFYLITTFNVIWILCLLYPTYSYLIQLYMVILYINCELNIITENILVWGNSYKKFKTTDEQLASFKQIIRDHQEVLRIMEGLRKAIGFPFLSRCILVPIIMVMLIMATLKQLKNDVSLAFIAFLGFIVAVPNELLCCWIGEMLQSTSLAVNESLYEIPWYQMNSKVKKDLLFMMFKTQQPIMIHYKGYGCLNLKTFMEIMNNAYSLFMFFNTFS
ncbi:hypothetical protein O3M35_001067 [Rhynocoris fuscipes]|uniref:Odorant receptor n=1 Tax=Rhynocoris fuscipes TaxID=488301 RepID=A0AAW1DRZ8_9HEMI